MRKVTPQEGESWRALAQQHGFGSAEGRFVLGRFIVEDRDENGLLLCVVTPIPAGLDTEKAQIETLPVMFHRTPADEIVVPGRWWQMMFENVSADAAAPAEMRQMAATMAATTICRDVLLPADSDTVEIGIADSQGNMTRYEALPPGTRMRARLDRNPSRSSSSSRRSLFRAKAMAATVGVNQPRKKSCSRSRGSRSGANGRDD
jgi:hypothetical protein